MSGSEDNPLFIFVEGTLTSGKHILKFKKGIINIKYLGAFSALLPVKPVIFKEEDANAIFSLSVGVSGAFYHMLCSLCYLYHRFTFIELPVITPTDYMFEHFAKPNQEKWETFAEVVRDIYAEIGDFEKSNKNFRDSNEYQNILTGVNLTK